MKRTGSEAQTRIPPYRLQPRCQAPPLLCWDPQHGRRAFCPLWQSGEAYCVIAQNAARVQRAQSSCEYKFSPLHLKRTMKRTKNAQLVTVCEVRLQRINQCHKGKRWRRKGKRSLFQGGAQPSRPSRTFPPPAPPPPGRHRGPVARPGLPRPLPGPSRGHSAPRNEEGPTAGAGPIPPGRAAAPVPALRPQLCGSAPHGAPQRREPPAAPRTRNGSRPSTAAGGPGRLRGGNSSPGGGELRLRPERWAPIPGGARGPGQPELGGARPAAGWAGGPSDPTAPRFCRRPSAEIAGLPP